MTTYGYKFFTFSMHRHGSDKALALVLGNLSESLSGELAASPPHKNDALVAMYGILHGLQGQRVDERHSHLSVDSVAPLGRCIRFTVELGTSGQTSTFRDPDAGDRSVFNRADRHIETNKRRGLLVVPTNSTVGLLALEARSRTTGMTLLSTSFKRGIRHHTTLITDFDAIVHQEALDKFLEEAKVNAVTLSRRGLPADIADQLEVRQPEAHLGTMQLTISRGKIPAFKQQLTSKFRQDDQARDRLLSVGGFDFDELNVKLKVGERQTTLSISADQAPAFVYEIATRQPPTDEEFYQEVLAMVPEVGPAFGVYVGANWHDGVWSQPARETKLVLPAPEVSNGERE
jgi:hypothetical protein